MPFQLVSLLAFFIVSASYERSCLDERRAAEWLHQESRDRVKRGDAFITWRKPTRTATSPQGVEAHSTPETEQESRVRGLAADHVTDDISQEDHVTWYIPECDPITGGWMPLQRDSDDRRWCVHSVTGEVVSEKSDILSSCEGCLMSRLVNMRDIRRAEEAGSTANNAYFAECQEGKPELYEEKQCWNGYFNACWCVDPVSGQATTFPSEKEVNCEFQPGSADNMARVSSSPTWCQVIENLITHYNRVYPGVMYGYLDASHIMMQGGGDNLLGDATLQPDILMEIRCGEDGNFAEEQCLGAECWCVDRLTGHVREGGCRRGKRDVPEEGGMVGDEISQDMSNDVMSEKVVRNCLEVKRAQLEAFYEFVLRGVILENLTIPKCTSGGLWSELQCSNQTVKDETLCWCVDQVTGLQTTGASVTLRSCDTCWAHVLRTKKAQVEDYTTCDETGRYYTPIQCNIDGDCWCVDHVTGTLLAGALGSRPNIADSRVTGEECEILDRYYNLK